MSHFYVGVFIQKPPLTITDDDVMTAMEPHSIHAGPDGGEWDSYDPRAVFAPAVSDAEHPPFPCYAVVTLDGTWHWRPSPELLSEHRDASFVVLDCHV